MIILFFLFKLSRKETLQMFTRTGLKETENKKKKNMTLIFFSLRLSPINFFPSFVAQRFISISPFRTFLASLRRFRVEGHARNKYIQSRLFLATNFMCSFS